MARSRFPLLLLTGLVGLLACDATESPTGVEVPTEPPDAPAGLSAAMGRWEPTSFDTCSKEIHDAWSTVGPDGKLYPTWHPPVDPLTGCTFGHEHGRDPRQSDLYRELGPIPFGYANEYLTASGFVGERHEDHVGHKIEWENDIEMRLGAGGSAGDGGDGAPGAIRIAIERRRAHRLDGGLALAGIVVDPALAAVGPNPRLGRDPRAGDHAHRSRPPKPLDNLWWKRESHVGIMP